MEVQKQQDQDSGSREEADHQLRQLKTTEERRQYQDAMKSSGPYLTLGIQLALSIALFSGIGYWLDKSSGTSPLWIGIMTGVGSVLSLSYFIITVLRLSKNEETKEQKK